jgi:chromosome segregation protein
MPLRLKSLELNGYKTFARQTLFAFSDKVTIIVGPNGSGKSNIADSMRWVLGEQSFRLLRGKRTEDMIFSGSENRPRAGMASVTMTFDNSDNWLPIDFTEVSVARRAYRDGQNEYLINGQRVRLKDVSELLAQSGLAERTYTIIGQGLVDAALALKAEERRRLFEEAAGIGLHRSRRQDALRRLDKTQRNLERIQDILAEIQPRLRSLERQARRAQQHEQIKKDLRVLLMEWYGYHWHQKQEELAKTYKNVRSRELELNHIRRELTTVEDRSINYRSRVQELRMELNTWHKSMSELHSKRETLNRELAVGDERLGTLRTQRIDTEREINNIQEELFLHQDRINTGIKETKNIAAELKDAQSQALKAQQDLEDRQSERSDIEMNVQKLREKLSDYNSRRGELNARISERKSFVSGSQEQLESLATSISATSKELRISSEHYEKTQTVMNELSLSCDDLDMKFKSIQKSMEIKERELKELQEKRSGFLTGIASLHAQLDVALGAEAKSSNYSEGSQVLIQAARKNLIKGPKGVLSEFLEVPPELDVAIDAALGEFVDSVLLDTEPDKAIQILLDEAKRGVLLPLKKIRNVDGVIHDYLESDEILGIASELVNVSEELNSVIDLLLGQVIIVQDRDSAKRVIENKPPGVCAVTLNGEVFHASGPVIIRGKYTHSKGMKTFGETKRSYDLQKKISSKEQEERELNRQISQVEEILSALVDEREKHNQELAESRKKLGKFREAIVEANLLVDKSNRQIKWYEDQRERILTEIETSRLDIDTFIRNLESVEDELSQISNQILEENSKLIIMPLDELQSQYAHWRTLSAVAHQASTGGASRLEERKSTYERLSQSKEMLISRMEELDNSIISLGEEIFLKKESETLVRDEINLLQAEIDPAERELEEIEQEQTSFQNTELEARKNLSMAEQRYSQARIVLTRHEETQQTLQRRIEDDFGLVAYDYADQVTGPTPLPFEGMVEQLPKVDNVSEDIDGLINRQRAQLRRMGPINPEAQIEYREVQQRHEFLTEQVADLNKAELDVRQVINELDSIMEREFRKTFEEVALEFKQIFTRLFGGGSARLVLSDPNDIANTGIDIDARLPGRRTHGLSLLSGGERSLTATALVFALLKISPTPFCLLDEVDAMLDEANTARFRELLDEMSQNTQFVIVTHNRNTVEAADVIYGVTMGRDSASQILSLKLDEVSRIVD